MNPCDASPNKPGAPRGRCPDNVVRMFLKLPLPLTLSPGSGAFISI